jgi:hypothetical protein
MAQSKVARYDFRVRIQVPRHTSDAVLLKYLKSKRHNILSRNEMLLVALRAFWVPAAHAHKLKCSNPATETDFRRLVQVAIAELQEQIDMLQRQFLADTPVNTAVKASEKCTSNLAINLGRDNLGRDSQRAQS